VFVLNALGGASVAGFVQSGGRLIPQPSWQRDLGLGTTPATASTATPGQIGFTPGGSHLVVTTKGAADTVEVFRVDGPGVVGVRTPLGGALTNRCRRQAASRSPSR